MMYWRFLTTCKHYLKLLHPANVKVQQSLVLTACLLLGAMLSVNVEAGRQQPPDDELRKLLKQTISESSSFEDRFDAEVWLVDMSNRLKRIIKDHKKRLEILKLVHREATRAGISPELVLAVIHTESHFDRFAISSVGAQGLMQVMPFWKKEIGRPQDNLTQNSTNLRYGCTILKHYIDIEKGNISRALARYNGSLGKYKYPAKVLSIWQKYWFVKSE